MLLNSTLALPHTLHTTISTSNGTALKNNRRSNQYRFLVNSLSTSFFLGFQTARYSMFYPNLLVFIFLSNLIVNLKFLSEVPRGSVLGPVLFLVFVNHLAAWVTSEWSMFADDFKMYSFS